MQAIILYGPPAAGKDTITKALTQLDKNYQLYPRLKVGTGRTVGYRMTTLSRIDALRSADCVIWETCRYDALYVIDRVFLTDMLETCIPILHVGQTGAVKAVTVALPPDAHRITVWLWCPRDTAVRRIARRGTDDMAARLRAWDETAPLPEADISINTARVLPSDAAMTIHSLSGHRAMPGRDHAQESDTQHRD